MMKNRLSSNQAWNTFKKYGRASYIFESKTALRLPEAKLEGEIRKWKN